MYSISQYKTNRFEISGLAATFGKGTNWVLMNSDKLLVGCGWGYMYENKKDQGFQAKITGPCVEHKSYSIINLKDSRVIKTGEMNENRQGYGFVKIQDMYYAVLGHQSGYSSSSIDIFNDNSGKWQLVSDLNYHFWET